jgi:serine/threonine protein phosphatase 1
MGRRFVIGDIHGAYRALIQCMEKADFNYEEDELVCLGDVCDGWPETRRCMDLLLGIRKLTYVMGNHDTWFLKWMKTGDVENIWYVQGGEASIMSYAGKPIPSSHIQLLERAKEFHLDNNVLFVHAGILPHMRLSDQNSDVFFWDRTLARLAMSKVENTNAESLTPYDEIYIGHTPTRFGKPVKGAEVWLMDTGAGWEGNLSMMNIGTKEYFVSDKVPELYPGIQGRSRW